MFDGRKLLFSAVNSTITASGGLGEYPVGGFPRISGQCVNVGSVSLRWRMGVTSGTYGVSSTMTINSGQTIIDFINYGLSIDFGFTAVQSTQFSITMFKEPIR